MKRKRKPALITYFLTGTVTDGRRWGEALILTPEFIAGSAINLLSFLAFHCKSWDDRNDCKTVKFEVERY